MDLGYNYRMTDIQAAIGLEQIKRLDEYIEKRNLIAKNYTSKLANSNLKLPYRHNLLLSSYHLYIIRLDPFKSKVKRRDLFEKLRNNGIGVNVHYIPIHLQPFYKKLGFKKGAFPNAENYYQNAISIPIFPQLKKIDQEKIITTIKSLVK